MSRQFNLTKTSLSKINNFLDSVEDKIEDQEFFEAFNDIVYKDVKMIKDCAETSIADFLIVAPTFIKSPALIEAASPT